MDLPERVNLVWFDRRIASDEGNFGDMLSPVLVEEVARARGIDPDAQVATKRYLVAVGSAIGQTPSHCTVWGAGYEPSYARQRRRLVARHLDVRAVRGPLTAQALVRAGAHVHPEVPLGDPAILLPLFYTPQSPDTDRRPLVLLHEADLWGGSHVGRTIDMPNPAGVEVVSVTCSDWRDVVDMIARASVVISSSLHGIIVAEAYGVPAVRLASRKVGADFKFADYYRSTGRSSYPRVDSVAEALARPGIAVRPPGTLATMRERLLASFPADLWY